MELFYDYIFWILIAALTFHFLEEHLSGWLQWINKETKIAIDFSRYLYIQAFALIFFVLFAIFGWMIPALALAGSAALFIDGLLFHVLLSIKKRKCVPGTASAMILFFPLSFFTYYAAVKGGVSFRDMLISFILGGLICIYPLAMLALNKNPIESQSKK